MSERPPSEIETDIERLEAGLRQLKIQYDMFFAGAIPKQPTELRAEVERMIKRYANAPMRKYAHRFHFNSLAARFTSMTELWSKTLRTFEEGDRTAPALADRIPAAEQVLARCHLRDPLQEDETLKLLHKRFLEARHKAGEEKSTISLQSFIRSIQTQAKKIKETTGCENVELRLILQERKVVLKARPGRP